LAHPAGHLMRIGIEPPRGGGDADAFEHLQRRVRAATFETPIWRTTVSLICSPIV
jgi:hypothetical protein